MDEDTQADEPQANPPDPPRRRLERSTGDRMLTGVAGGIGAYLGIDATVVRIVTIGLTLAGGAGVLVYLAALLLMPEQGAPGPSFGRAEGGRAQGVTVFGVILLGAAAVAGLAVVGTVIGWVLFPVAFLVVAGMFAWWIASGERPAGTPGDILKRSALGLVLLLACFGVAVGGAWAAASGSGAVAAAIVIGAGTVLVAAAFVRPARWLILPALSLGLTAAFVSATGISFDGGIGEREYRPTALQDVRGSYDLGIGELVVDLRDARLPAGDHRIKVDIGVGHAVVLVPENVCVATDAKVGIGAVDSFDRNTEGVDVRHDDTHQAPTGTPRVILDGDVGVGMLDVHHASSDRDHREPGDGKWESFEPGGNDACVGGSRAGSGHHG